MYLMMREQTLITHRLLTGAYVAEFRKTEVSDVFDFGSSALASSVDSSVTST